MKHFDSAGRNDNMISVLVFTSLFPNAAAPELGSFIKKRMAAYHRKKDRNVVVVAPIPWFPKKLSALKVFARYSRFAHIPYQEEINGMLVYHPRYPLIPKVSMVFHGWLMYWFSISLVRRLHKQYGFRIIDAHFVYPDGMAAQLLGKKIQQPVVVSARGSDITEYLEYSLIRPRIIRTLGRVHAVISVSQGLKQIMADAGIVSDGIRVIPNGIDPGKFYPEDRQNARKNLGIDHSGQIILSVASLIPLKGHDLTVDAVAMLVEKLPDLHLYIIGSGPEKALLEKKIAACGLAGRVYLPGQIPNDDLLDWYNAADVFCLSSSREGCPNVLTEALCCGIPCVVTRAAGADEMVVHGENGVVVERNSASIAKGVKTVLTTQWDRQTISHAISSRTWDRVAHEVDEVFMEVLQRYENERHFRKR